MSRRLVSGSGLPFLSRQISALGVALAEGVEDGFLDGALSLRPLLASSALQQGHELGAVFVEGAGQRGQQIADAVLLGAAGFFLDVFGLGLLLAGFGQVLEGAFVFQTGDAFRRGLEVEAQGALDGDLAVAEVVRGEDLERVRFPRRLE